MDAKRLRIVDCGVRIAATAIKTAAIAGLVVVLFHAAAQGQTTAPAGGEIVLPVSLKAQLGTITGVIVLSLAIVELLKRCLQNVPYAQLVPLWCYAVAVANVLAILAKYTLGTLPGDTVELLWQASLGAATAGGFYTWIRQPTTGPSEAMESKQTPQRSGGGWTGVLILALALGGAGTAGGCSQPPSQLYVAATHAYTGTLGAITTLAKAGMIPLADMERIETVRGKAAESLDRLREAVAAGNPITARWYLAEVNRLLDELLVYQIKAEQFRERQDAGGKEQTRHEPDLPGIPRPGLGGPAAWQRTDRGRNGNGREGPRGEGGGDRPGRAGPLADGRRVAGRPRAETGGGGAGGQSGDAETAVAVREQAELRRALSDPDDEWD